MEKTQVFSLRVSDRLMDIIAAKLVQFGWWKRNAFVTSILENLLENASDKDIKTLICHKRYTRRKLIISISEESIS